MTTIGKIESKTYFLRNFFFLKFFKNVIEIGDQNRVMIKPNKVV